MGFSAYWACPESQENHYLVDSAIYLRYTPTPNMHVIRLVF